jgi:hypothetical protein
LSGFDLIAQVAPTDYHQNNLSLFKLARLMKSYENAIGRTATQLELQFLFDRWSLVARRFWRRELTRDDYYAEFLEAYSYARIGLDENPIELAVCRAKRAPLPEVRGFTAERIRLLVAICREIQQITDANPFFLPTRKLGEILGAHWTEVGRWLRILEKPLQVIHLAPGEVRRRGGNRSPRYHYGPPTPKSVEFTVRAPLSPPAFHALTAGIQPNDVESAAHPNPKMLKSVATVGGLDVDCPFEAELSQTTDFSLCEKCEKKGGEP